MWGSIGACRDTLAGERIVITRCLRVRHLHKSIGPDGLIPDRSLCFSQKGTEPWYGDDCGSALMLSGECNNVAGVWSGRGQWNVCSALEERGRGFANVERFPGEVKLGGSA